ncbi:hypothetical protein [Candidatus Uabimicrobium amorphum]|uniref:Uncharacterized protein n=1 Tax=Uabimicrobium amorphum TaxID=2596890 RepID=A0A5S9F4C4_UABAM|nr:hypothetical protein [Candidatus Uabimicrobium amorphum]BBM84334.1 hypothetical protein UABAM_02693 [Candidatus Uabimicrobium amorphum]
MKKSIFENKKNLWISLGIFGVMVLFVLPIVFDVESKSAQQKQSSLCYINLQRLGTCLLQYEQKHGKFPQALSTLVKEKYISPEFAKSPLDGSEYVYLNNVNKHAPFNVPLIAESIASHVTPRNERYGMVLLGDFSVVRVGERYLNLYVNLIKKLRKVAVINDGKLLLEKLNSELVYRTDNETINLLLAKLGQLKYQPAIPTIKRCQNYYNPANTEMRSLARSIAFQANYTLFQLAANYDDKFMAKFLKSDNYFHRKKAWRVLNAKKAVPVNTAISPRHAEVYYNQRVRKK